jgi:hypothetical protein
MHVDTLERLGLGRGVGRLGLKPGQACYDSTRPSWLPYWFGTLSEQACQLGVYPGVTTLAEPAPIPTPPAPGVPAGGETGAVTDPNAVDALIAATDTSVKATTQTYFDQVAADEAARQKGCAWYQSAAADGVCQVGGMWFWALLAGGGVLAFTLLAGRK